MHHVVFSHTRILEGVSSTESGSMPRCLDDSVLAKEKKKMNAIFTGSTTTRKNRTIRFSCIVSKPKNTMGAHLCRRDDSIFIVFIRA